VGKLRIHIAQLVLSSKATGLAGAFEAVNDGNDEGPVVDGFLEEDEFDVIVVTGFFLVPVEFEVDLEFDEDDDPDDDEDELREPEPVPDPLESEPESLDLDLLRDWRLEPPAVTGALLVTNFDEVRG
jgi:hypothetical protein